MGRRWDVVSCEILGFQGMLGGIGQAGSKRTRLAGLGYKEVNEVKR